MGKFQSKLVSRSRQSPEGDSLASNVLTCHRELECNTSKSKLTETMYVEVKKIKSKNNCNLKVVLPPRRAHDREKNFHFQVREPTKEKNSLATVTVCNEEPQTGQEWLFTLYNFDTTSKVTKEDMSSLILVMYEVLEAAVKQPYAGTTPLRIKLVVTPSPCSAAEKEQRMSQEAGRPARSLYCVGENVERRNHYLNLAGIENYNSKFDSTDSPSHGRRQVSSALQHHPVAVTENCTLGEPQGGLLETKTMPVRKESNRGDEKSCRLHGQHPASWCHPPKTHLQRSHSKRLHSRLQDPASPFKHADIQVQSGRDSQIFPNLQTTCEVPLAKKHDHHHHHEHHHHHHHHHYHHS
ncbi:protein naked cuticle homolog 2 [Odontesthes bonariensis]|uniref:protein naked cuticle homolog 2 isoform X2 n=1 Tax=Odontesthes bonariensis TaxID=219752 RepID=UPI003F588717